MGLPSSGSELIDQVSATVLYVGKAKRHAATTSSAIWQIQKITYDGSGNPTAVLWADSNELYDNIWDNRNTTVVYG